MEPPRPAEPPPSSASCFREKFDTARDKFLLKQADKLRELEAAMRDEATAMLQSLHDQVSAQSSVSSRSGLHLDAMIDELFARPEVHRGLVQWLPGAQAQQDAKTLVAELRDDLVAGDGNEARTTLNKLLPLYIKALRARELLEQFSDTRAPAASPGGKNGDKRLLGHLVLREMQPFLESIQMAYAEVLSGRGGSLHQAERVDVKETTKRLKAALFMFLNTANFASHNRGKLSYCQRLELCGAVGGMAETLPLIFQVSQAIQAASADKSETAKDDISPSDLSSSTSSQDDDGLPPIVVSDLSAECSPEPLMKAEGIAFTQTLPATVVDTVDVKRDVPAGSPAPLAESKDFYGGTKLGIAYYSKYLNDYPREKREKYEATLKHMALVPKARVCVDNSCQGCDESHSVFEALNYNPLVVTLKCPVPESCRHDIVHKKDSCLFNHGEYKSASKLRWYKKALCRNLSSCSDPNCLRSHSIAEICWMSPNFRTSNCPEGRDCVLKQICSLFHQEYHAYKRKVGKNEYVGRAEPILFVDRTVNALSKVPVQLPSKLDTSTRSLKSSRRLPSLVQYYQQQLRAQTSFSAPEQAKYSNVLKHMELLPKARMCLDGGQCASIVGGDGNKLCYESHSIHEVLSFNPLAMVLTCPTPSNCREDSIHKNDLCVFFHGEGAVPKDFLKAKRLLCAAAADCKDDRCVKSHSVAEVCWFFPIFRVYKCPQDQQCKRMGDCSYFHEEFHTKRDQTMNEVVGKPGSALFVDRGYAELQKVSAPAAPTTLDTHANRDEYVDVEDTCHLREEQPNSELLSTEDVHSDSSGLSGSADGEAAAPLLTNKATVTLLGHEIALEGYPADERAKYESVFAQMQQVPKARLCAQGENCVSLSSAGDASSCLESHSRLEALTVNPLAMVLKCPITGDAHRPSLCIFDHGNGSIPDDFLIEKKSLCEERVHCTDARCAKSHSLTEVCWFNPEFRVDVCPDGDRCLHKFSCSGFHADCHASQQNAAMNNQVGHSEAILFVERTCAELAKRQAEALPGIFAWLRQHVVSKMPGSDLSSNPPE